VKQLGGAGDGGRDVEARLVPALIVGEWNLYQAKHYNAGITPSEFFPELAKFFLQLVASTYGYSSGTSDLKTDAPTDHCSSSTTLCMIHTHCASVHHRLARRPFSAAVTVAS